MQASSRNRNLTVADHEVPEKGTIRSWTTFFLIQLFWTCNVCYVTTSGVFLIDFEGLFLPLASPCIGGLLQCTRTSLDLKSSSIVKRPIWPDKTLGVASRRPRVGPDVCQGLLVEHYPDWFPCGHGWDAH